MNTTEKTSKLTINKGSFLFYSLKNALKYKVRAARYGFSSCVSRTTGERSYLVVVS